MAGNYDRYWGRSKGTRSQFRLEGLQPFKCTYPVHLTDIMDAGQSSQSNSQRTEFTTSPFKETQTKAVREYEETINQLGKENFDLKVRLFLCEEAHKETYHVKGGYNDEKEDCIQIIVNLRIEAENLKKELNGKDEDLQSALEKCSAEVEKYQAELLEAQKKINEQQEFIEILEQLPKTEDYNEIRRQFSAMVSESEYVKQLSAEKDEEIEKANLKLQKLEDAIVVLNKKVKQRDEAIKSCAMKYHKEVDHIPKHLRPIIKSVIEAAVSNNEKELLSYLEDFKKSLSEIMSVPSNLQSTYVENSHSQNSSAAHSSRSSKNSLVKGNLSATDSSIGSAVLPSQYSIVEGDLDSSEINASNALISHSDKTIQCDLGIEENKQDLKNQLGEAYTKINCLEDELEKKQNLVVNDLERDSSSSVTDITRHSFHSRKSDKSLQEFGTSENINELKEEILMLVLAIEQKDKELSDFNQKLMSQDNLLTPADEGYLAERDELQRRLAVSCSVNDKLLKHLQSLERFMEDLLHQKYLSTSSLENINESEDFISRVSNCLNESRKFSRSVSDELSMCEGSRLLDLNDTTLHRSEFNVSDRKSIGRLLDSQFSQEESDIPYIYQEGRHNFYPCVKENQNVLRSEKLNLSEMYSSQKLQSFTGKKQTTVPLTANPDNVIVLKTSNNEDLILLLNDQGDPKDVLIRNNDVPSKNSEQRRRRCWDTSANNDFWNSEKFATQCKESVYNVENSNIFKSNYMRYNAWMSSDSDTWSEPDRNVSMQRIGIDVQTSPITSRSPRKTRLKDRRAAEDSTKNESASSYVKLHTFSKRRRSSETSKTSFICKKCQKQSQQHDDTLEEENSNIILQELQQLYNENSNCQNDIKNLTEMLKSKEEIIDSLCKEKNTLVSDINNLKEKLTSLQKNNDMLISKQNESFLKLKEKDSLNEGLKSIIDSLELNVKDSNAACEKLQMELNQTKERLVVLDKKCAKYENTLSSYSKDKTGYYEKISALEKREKELMEDIEDMTSQKNSLLHKLKEEEKHTEAATKENIDMAEKMRATNKEIVQLQKSNKELEELKSSLLNAKSSVETNLESSNSEKEKLIFETKNLKDNIEKLKSNCSSLAAEIHFLTNSKQNIIDLLLNFESLFASNLKTLSDGCGVKFSLNTENFKDVEEMSYLIDENEEVNALLKNIITENLKFKELASDFCQQTENIKKVKQTVENEKFELKNEIKHKEREIEILNDEITELQGLKNQIYQLQSSSEMFKADHELLEKQKNLLEQKEISVRTLEVKNHELTEKIKILQDEKNNFEQTVKTANAEIVSLEERLVALEKLKEDYRNLSDLRQKDIDKLQDSIYNLQSQTDVLLNEKMNQSERSRSKLMEAPEKAVSPDSSTIIEVSSDSIVQSVSKSLDTDNSCSSVKSAKSDQMLSSNTAKKDREKYLKHIKSLQKRLEAADSRIESLEQEKNSLRENLLSYVHKGKETSIEESEGKDSKSKKLAELESKLENKQSFIKDLKSDLYQAHDSLIDKQKKIDKLQQEIFKLKKLTEDKARTTHQNIPGSRLSDTFLLSTEASISDLRKRKKELINSLFGLQKQFYETKDLHVNHFEKFVQHIESLRALQVCPSLLKSESAPLLNSSLMSSIEHCKKWDRTLKNTKIDLEVDIECLQNFKIFMRFFSPTINQSSDNETKIDKATHTDLQEETSKSVRSKETSKLPSKNFSSGVDHLRMESDKPSHDRLATTASTISLKLDWIENTLKTVIEEFEQLSDMGSVINETARETAAKTILLKLFDGLESLQENANEIFFLNSRLKSLELFDNDLHHSNSKQDISDHESLLSDETIALSRSASLSPVSFDGQFAPNSAHQKLKERTLINSYIKQSEEIKRIPLRPFHKVISSSRDSVFQRSHYSSPDLGIESDPNHEHSAPEHVEKFHSTKISTSKHDLSASTMYRNLDKQRLSSIYNFSDSSFKVKDKSLPFVMNDTLHAIGVLKDFELLKKEVAESIVGIKSILSRTGDGMQHINCNTSPQKSQKLEYSTFKAIKDTCMNIDVCLQKANKLVNNFWVVTCPTEDELRKLLQMNDELNDKLKKICELKKKQEMDFKDVLDRLKQAETRKEQQELKISKKLVKTKKILRIAENKILETRNRELPLLAKLPSKTNPL